MTAGDGGRRLATRLEKPAMEQPAVYAQRIGEYPARKVAGICDLKVSDIAELATLFGSSSPAMIRIGDGVNRHQQGGQTVRAIACLPALTGQYGKHGGGLGCSTGDYFNWDEEAVQHWSDCPESPGRIVNMNRLGAALTGEVRNPPIRSLYVFGANPAVSAPNTEKIRAGLRRKDLFTVVHEMFLTDTARYADIVLPATTQLEHCDLHRGYGHTLLQYNQPAIAPRGESRSNWDVMRELARGMGFTDHWLQQSPDEIIEEILGATMSRTTCLRGIDLPLLKQGAAVQYAAPGDAPFADLAFPTPSGKIE